MQNDLVSVIIPTYNRANSLGRAIESVLNQTYQFLECIIVDDGSTDNTGEMVRRISDERVIYVRLDQNAGACHARNIGILKARGDYIAFQDSDDIWYEDKLEKELACIEEKNADVVFCQMYSKRYEKAKGIKFPGSFFTQRKVTIRRILTRNFASTQTLLIRRSVLREIIFDEKLPRFQDWDLMIRLVKGYKVVYLKEILVEQNMSLDSIGNDPQKGIEGINHIMEKYANDYKRYPKLNYFNYYLLGSYQMKLGEKSSEALWNSLRRNPFSCKCWIKWLSAKFLLKK